MFQTRIFVEEDNYLLIVFRSCSTSVSFYFMEGCNVRFHEHLHRESTPEEELKVLTYGE